MSLMRAPEVARLCGVDLKTIHNWVNSGRLRASRTPGRHLRFQPPEVRAFMLEHGFEVPPELHAAPRPEICVIVALTPRWLAKLDHAARRWGLSHEQSALRLIQDGLLEDPEPAV
jgi:excisionase family DNA binding protein